MNKLMMMMMMMIIIIGEDNNFYLSHITKFKVHACKHHALRNEYFLYKPESIHS
jgi:hypothetical protein